LLVFNAGHARHCCILRPIRNFGDTIDREKILAVRGCEIFESSKVNVGYAFETQTFSNMQLLIIARLPRLS